MPERHFQEERGVEEEEKCVCCTINNLVEETGPHQKSSRAVCSGLVVHRDMALRERLLL